jgi:hypothetical protein
VQEVYEKYYGPEGGVANPLSEPKILLADDDIFSNMALRSMIESSGQYHVHSFYNGADVFESY